MNKKRLEILSGKTLFRREGEIFIQKSTDLPQYIQRLHMHDFVEIGYVTSGECFHVSANKRYLIKKGDMFIINYETPHKNILIKNAQERYDAYTVGFSLGFIDAVMVGSKNFKDLSNSFLLRSIFPIEKASEPDIYLFRNEKDEFTEIFKRMHDEYQAALPGYIEIIRAYLIELLIKVFRSLSGSYTAGISGESRKNVEQAIEYLKTNYEMEISLEQIALRSFLSKSYFRKLFYSITNKSFITYLNELRIEKACLLLAQSGLTVKDICEKVGYGDRVYFYEVFKRITGATPGEYRKRIRENE